MKTYRIAEITGIHYVWASHTMINCCQKIGELGQRLRQ